MEVEVKKRCRNWDRAEIVRVVEAGPDRVAPPCPHFGDCGGCQWQHVSYSAQRAAKEQILRSALRRICSEVTVGAAESPYGYRRRVKVHHSDGKVGFLARRSHRLVSVGRCLLLEPALQEALDRQRPTLRGSGERRICARADLADAGEPPFLVTSEVFAQAGDAADQTLRKAVVANVRGPRILELFAGAGNFTRLFGDADVTAVESDERALALLQKNVPSARAMCARAEAAIRKLAESGERFDTILLDPPRRGAAELIDDLARLAPPRIVYVSCDPMTLARDTERLVQRGYAVASAEGFDLMPQTYHIEAMLVLDRRA